MKLMLEWEPLFERFLENDVPVLMEFSTLAEAKAARKIYYRIREYYQQDEEWLKKYGSVDRKSTRLNSSHIQKSRMPSSA